MLPVFPPPLLPPQPHTSVAQGGTFLHSSFCASFFLFILHSSLVPPLGYCPHLPLCPPSTSTITSPSCDVQTAAAAAAGGDGGEAVTFKLWLSNPSLSDALGTRKRTREGGGKEGEKDQIYLMERQSWCLASTNIVSLIRIADVLCWEWAKLGILINWKQIVECNVSRLWKSPQRW